MYTCPICHKHYPLVYRLDDTNNVCETCFANAHGVSPWTPPEQASVKDFTLEFKLDPAKAAKMRETWAKSVFVQAAVDPSTGDSWSTDAKAAGVVDHGHPRVATGNGAQRESRGGRGRFDLIPPYPLQRLAQHYEAGAAKYDDRNWEKGLPLESFVCSAFSHLLKLLAGDVSEDHESAILWNIAGHMHTAREIKEGRLPANLADGAPWFKGGK